VGRGDLRSPAHDERYLADLKKLAEGKRVTFVLSASDEELDTQYARASVVVVPSVGRDRYGGTTSVPELLGLVAIEAAAHGVPVVASAIASLPRSWSTMRPASSCRPAMRPRCAARWALLQDRARAVLGGKARSA